MADGSAAKLYIAEHKDDIHEVTGRRPVVLGELEFALKRGDVKIADAMAENYVVHGRLEATLTAGGRAVEKR